MHPSNLRRRLARLLGVLVLLVGLAGVFVRVAPTTTWAVPVRAGDTLDGWTVDDVRRTPFEVRVELSRGDVHRAVRWVDWSNTERPILARVGHVTLVADDPTASTLPDTLIRPMVAAITARQDSWPAPPPFVAPKTVKIPVRAQVESALAEGVIVAWLAAMVGLAPELAGWLGGVGAGAWSALVAMIVAQVGFVRWMGIGGVWHSNQHGFDRIADVEQGTPPAVAALGLLHGHGYYALFQPLFSMFGGRVSVFTLSQGVTAVGLVALFAWLFGLWGKARPALLGVAFAASLPIVLRLSASEDMYVPTVAWTCFALALVEAWLRTGSMAALALAVPPSVLAMQTRAELLLLLPVWVLLGAAVRRPDRLRAALTDGRAWAIVVTAVGLLTPRLLEIVASPPPSDLRRTALDPMADPRLVLLAALALVLVAAHPWPRARWETLLPSSGTRRALGAVGLLALVGGVAAYALALRAQGGPLQRTWQLHAAFDPSLVAPWVGALVALGAGISARTSPRRVVALGLSLLIALWIYLPQVDCLSTFVRTGLSTVPLLAALAAPALDAIVARLGGMAGSFVVGGLLASGVVYERPWMTARDAKAAYWDLVEAIRARVPEGTTVVWLADADAPAAATHLSIKPDRARLEHHLGPAWETASLTAWRAGQVDPKARVVFARTPDCGRVLLSARGSLGLAGDREVRWRYLDVSRLATTARITVDGVGPEWIDPACAAALEQAGPPLWSVVPDARNAGSIFETAVGADRTVGLYPVSTAPRAPEGSPAPVGGVAPPPLAPSDR